MVVDNPGRAPAPASEVALCLARGEGGDCRESLALLPLPALGPGERVELRPRVEAARLGSAGHAFLRAEVDPERATGEAKRANNVASADAEVELPRLSIAALRAVRATPRLGEPLELEIRLRNVSRVAASEATEMQLSGVPRGACPGGAGGGAWGLNDEGQYRMAVPRIGPGQTWVVTVAVGRATRCAAPMQVTLDLDPAMRRAWGEGHEGAALTDYVVKP